MADMEKRVETEIKGQKASEVTELNLDNCKASSVSGLTDEFENLENLSMINCGLSSLEGFPKLPSLTRLDLSDNKIAKFDQLLECPNLTHLLLCGNKIASVSDLAPLKGLKKLESLDLFNCDVTKNDDDAKYRSEIFGMFENLKVLDGTYENGEPESDVESVGEDAGGEDHLEAEDGDDDEDVGLSYLESSKVMDEDESEEYAPQDDDEEEGGEQQSRGTKRKREEEEEGDDDGDDE